MTDWVVIPRLEDNKDIYEDYPVVGKPGWWRVTRYGTGEALKPLIRCNCGHVSGIGLHHVHANGEVTQSYFDADETHPSGHGRKGACGWHVWLKLEGWEDGDIPPDPK